MVDPIFFIHIPKTAGTSLRVAMLKFFGEKRICSDYALKAHETHDLVRKHIYTEGDLFGLYDAMQRGRFSILTGHMPYKKYKTLFPLSQVFTFLREPLARTVSEFKHFQRHNNYDKTLPEFISEKRNINVMSRFLQGVPLQAIGYLGLAEDYAESLVILNATYGWRLQNLSLNSAPDEQSKKVDVSDEVKALFEDLNKQDIELYQQACEIYTVRKTLFKQRQPYTCGAWHQDSKGIIKGYAFRHNSAEPIRLIVRAGDRVLTNAIATEFHPSMQALGASRAGHVGFSVDVKSSALSLESVQVVVADTGQVLSQE